MILTCPNCSTRFLLPAMALGPEGRHVKCSECAEVWHQKTDPYELADERAGDNDDVQEIPDAVKPIAEGSALPSIADEEDEGQGFRWKQIAAISCALFVLLFTFLLSFHGVILKSWPASQALYSLVGIEMKVEGEALLFEDIKAIYENGFIQIEGRIMNLENKEIKIPLMEASLRTADGDIVSHWYIKPPAKIIQPQETLSFKARHESDDASIGEVNVRFLMGSLDKKNKTSMQPTQTKAKQAPQSMPEKKEKSLKDKKAKY